MFTWGQIYLSHYVTSDRNNTPSLKQIVYFPFKTRKGTSPVQVTLIHISATLLGIPGKLFDFFFPVCLYICLIPTPIKIKTPTIVTCYIATITREIFSDLIAQHPIITPTLYT